MYFMRHGQSEFNLAFGNLGRDPGNIPDPHLTDHGKKQALDAGKKLINYGFKKIVCSPFTRAIETSLQIAKVLDLDVEIELLIGEYRIYSCDYGSPSDELRANFPDVDFKDFHSSNWWLPFPEDISSLALRTRDFEDKWRSHEDWGRILFVSHYYFINSITGACPDNTELVKL